MDWLTFIAAVRDIVLDPDVVENTRRLAFAVALSAIVGYERQRKGRPAGIRTHILVCLGSTLLMIVSESIAAEWAEKGTPIWLDQGRIAAGIVTGVGFLGAGTIVNYGRDQHGLTTAAMIWFVAALGIAAGSGMYLLATVSTVMATLVVVGLDTSRGLASRAYYILRVTLPNENLDVDSILKKLQQQKGVRARAVGIKTKDKKQIAVLEFKIEAKSEHFFVDIQKRIIDSLPEAIEIEILH